MHISVRRICGTVRPGPADQPPRDACVQGRNATQCERPDGPRGPRGPKTRSLLRDIFFRIPRPAPRADALANASIHHTTGPYRAAQGRHVNLDPWVHGRGRVDVRWSVAGVPLRFGGRLRRLADGNGPRLRNAEKSDCTAALLGVRGPGLARYFWGHKRRKRRPGVESSPDRASIGNRQQINIVSSRVWTCTHGSWWGGRSLRGHLVCFGGYFGSHFVLPQNTCSLSWLACSY